MKLLFLFLLVVIPYCLFSQDTLSVYFKTGSAQISKKGITTLQNIPLIYEFSAVDSIQIIGFSDSVGNMRSNLKLSRKRAKNVNKIVFRMLKEASPTSLYAKGESVKKDLSKNRRVDIILFYKKVIKATPPIAEDIIENIDTGCFIIDFTALAYCNVKTITKRNRKYVYIEALNDTIFTNRKHYYVVYNSNGRTLRRIRWKLKTTGRLWWRKKRLVAIIPKRSFDTFQFFTLQDKPCDGCHQSYLYKYEYTTKELMGYYDLFLMNNLQYTRSIFRPNKLKIRVPKEYVTINVKYYYKDLTKINIHGEINWFEKKGRRKRDYYYAKIDFYNNLPILYRTKMANMYYCYGGGEYKEPQQLLCGYNMMGKKLFKLGLEIGSFYQNDSITGYLAPIFKFNLGENFESSLLVGVNTNYSFYGEFDLNYQLLNFPFRNLSPVNKWENPLVFKPIRWYGKFDIGTTIKTSFNRKYQSFVENNVHFQFSIKKGGLYSQQFYVKTGIGRDILMKVNTKPYPFIQAGFRFYLNF